MTLDGYMNLRTIRPVMALLLAGHVVMGCSDDRAWTEQDSWYRPPPPSWAGNVSTLDSQRLIAVTNEKRITALTMLSGSSSRLLTPAEASDLAGVEVTPGPGMRFYLVRAVYLNEGTGTFQLRLAGTELEVHHGSLSRGAMPMKRAALIAQLKEQPTEVYVTCSMAQ